MLVALLAVYFVGGMLWLHRIDDDPEFALESSAPEGGSQSVAVAADLIDREINTHRWVANDPFFMPGSLLDNMPNFQQGIIAALSRFAIELADQIARTRGSSQIDPRPRSRLRPAEISRHGLDLRPHGPRSRRPRARNRSIAGRWPRCATTTSGSRQGQAMFETRADNLLATLERIAADMGSSSAALDQHLEEGGFWPDFSADDLFYDNKGRLYAYYLLLRALGADFAKVIEERDLEGPWRQMLASFRAAAALQPWVIVNGAPDSQLLPSHLASQGFFLLRARTQLREITSILLK